MSMNRQWRPTHLRLRAAFGLLAVVVTVALMSAAFAPVVQALPRDPVDPPDVSSDFVPPGNGFDWSVSGRFGDRVANPDEPDVPALVNYHYCAPERPNVNCRGNADTNAYTYDPAYVHPTALTAHFDGCPTSDEENAGPGHTKYLYLWQVLDTATNAVSFSTGAAHDCTLQHDFPIDPSTGAGSPTTAVTLTITDPASSTPDAPSFGSPFQQSVIVRDYLVVSMGDSYGAGEGNPDVPQVFASFLGIPLPIVQHGPEWEDQRCHRSATAGPAQAALDLEAGDPHSSVTFLSFACSGANISADAFSGLNPFDPYDLDPTHNALVDKGSGVLGPYVGTEPYHPDPGYALTHHLPDQVTEVVNAVGSRHVDALIMSGGGNDMGFANIATVCVLVVDCAHRMVTNPSDPGAVQGKTTLDVRTRDDIGALASRYDALADRLDRSGLSVSKLYMTEYPDSTRGGDGSPCSSILGDVIPTATQLGAGALIGLLSSVFPWVGVATIAAAAASGVIPPLEMTADEVAWAGSTALPSGGSNASTGLDRQIADAVARHAHDTVPWELVGGITEDFQGTGALSGGAGHGYCAPDSWIRTASDANDLQGPYNVLIHNDTTGTLHPTATGHTDIADRLYSDHLKSLVPTSPSSSPVPPRFAAADTNSTGNSVANLPGTTTVSSTHGTNGWLTGCTPTGSACASPGDHVVEQITVAVNTGTTVHGAGLSINGNTVNCATSSGLPSGVTCQQTLLDNRQVYKWSFQFAHDGVYRLDTTVTGWDDTAATFSREAKVDLNDPLPPTAAPAASVPATNGWYRAPVTLTFDVADPGNGGSSLQGVGVQGIQYQIDGGPQGLVSPMSQLPAGTPPEQAQVVVNDDGTHTVTYRTVDMAGRLSTPSTLSLLIDQTAPSVACGASDGAWHNGDVSIGCTSSDSGSGLADSTTATFAVATSVATGSETANALTASRNVCDVAGNCTPAGPIGGNKVDEKPPSITVSAPAAATYTLNQAVAAAYSCTDGGSGVTTCSGPTPTGQPIDTTSNGTKTFAVSATDAVGNASAQSVPYQVGFGVCALFDQTKSHKIGSTIPLKLQLCDASGVNKSSAAITLTVTGLVKVDNTASSVIDIATGDTADNGFRYDATLAGYIYNFQTKGLTAGTWALTFTTSGDSVSHNLTFDVR